MSVLFNDGISFWLHFLFMEMCIAFIEYVMFSCNQTKCIEDVFCGKMCYVVSAAVEV